MSESLCTGCGHAAERAQWALGPWELEPDRFEFTHAGLPCLLHRSALGGWCGYVGVPPGHPWYGIQYNGCTKGCDPATRKPPHRFEAEGTRPRSQEEADTMNRLMWEVRQREFGPHCDDYEHQPEVEVHGGLTFSGFSREWQHQDMSWWWFGFDCAHAGDLLPGIRAMLDRTPGMPPGLLGFEVYRTMEYAKEETMRLAEQLAALLVKE